MRCRHVGGETAERRSAASRRVRQPQRPCGPGLSQGTIQFCQIDRSSAAGRVVLEGHTIQIPDLSADAEYTYLGSLGGSVVGSALGVPLLHSGRVVGTITLLRRAAGPFSPRQIALVETFADQAVIAIENVRLFEEVQARTAELGEALQQQTATADVLKVISRSAFDLPTVLDTLVESAVHVCEAEKGAIFQRRGDLYHFAASFGFSPEYEQYALENPLTCWTGQRHRTRGARRQDDSHHGRIGRSRIR